MNVRKLVTIILCAIVIDSFARCEENLGNVKNNISSNSNDSSNSTSNKDENYYSDDAELLDFDFENSKNENNYEYYDGSNGNVDESLSNVEDINDKDNLDAHQQDNHPDGTGHSKFNGNPLMVKEKALKIALSKALTNKILRQKFVEVIPILRVLSSQQRLALAALISAQIAAKPGHELKLEQVKDMFGDYRKMIIPIVFDIANLVRHAAKTSLQQYQQFSNIPISNESGKNNIKQEKKELDDTSDISFSRRNDNIQVSSEHDYDTGDLTYEGIVDPQVINEQLYRESRQHLSNSTNVKDNRDVSIERKNRHKRSSPPFFPFSERRLPFRENLAKTKDVKTLLMDRKLNTTASQLATTNDDIISASLPSSSNLASLSSLLNFTRDNNNTGTKHDQEYNFSGESSDLQMPYRKVEDYALADLNSTDKDVNNSSAETLPTPESLIGFRQKINNNFLGSGTRKLPLLPPAFSSVSPLLSPPLNNRRTPGTRQRTSSIGKLSGSNCERFTTSMCIKADDYPIEQIMGSIRRHKHAMSALLAEYRDKAAELEYQEYLEELELNKKRREDDNEVLPGGMCSSVVRYARPQKARSASGEWKYIVNTGQHTQTLRLEKCSNPQESCSYLSENYRSRCIQVFNYHRLLSWDKNRGLHVDIFKVPTCCSCHVDGYQESFPPFSKNENSFISRSKDFSKYKIPKPIKYYPNSEDLEYEEDDDNFEAIGSTPYKFGNNFKRFKPSGKYDAVESLLSSSSKSTLGSYLSPPGSEYDTSLYNFKRGPNLSSPLGEKEINGGISSSGSSKRHHSHSRKPIGTLIDYSDDSFDQDLSASELGKEVTLRPSTSTTGSKKKRIPSVTSSKKPFSTQGKNTPILTGTTGKSTHRPFLSPSSTIPITTKSPPTPKKNIFSTKLTNSKTPDGSKRINYNYHPIIDFFEDNSQHEITSVKKYLEKDFKGNENGNLDKERRKGITIDSIGDNNWRPVIA